MSETGQKQTHGFQTEVKQLLQLMIHSLYSNKEIFLRELVSNAADASDKLRFKALQNADLFEGDANLRVRISADAENNTVTISDNGIGMTHDEIVAHLGTIAKSGTADFFSKLSGDQAKDSQLIGQFGVGFYSAFIVADKVTVRSRAAGAASNEAVEWSSEGEGEFTVQAIEKSGRGTDIILHLKEDEKEYADEWRLRSIVTKYSDHISVAVEMLSPEVEAVAEEKTTKVMLFALRLKQNLLSGKRLTRQQRYGRVKKLIFQMKNTTNSTSMYHMTLQTLCCGNTTK